jgi:hypothetical protein
MCGTITMPHIIPHHYHTTDHHEPLFFEVREWSRRSWRNFEKLVENAGTISSPPHIHHTTQFTSNYFHLNHHIEK